MGREHYRVDNPVYMNDSESESFAVRKPRPGLYLSPAAVVLSVLVALALAAAVGLIVHFAHPARRSSDDIVTPPVTSAPEVPPTLSDEDAQWSACVNMSYARGECK